MPRRTGDGDVERKPLVSFLRKAWSGVVFHVGALTRGNVVRPPVDDKAMRDVVIHWRLRGVSVSCVVDHHSDENQRVVLIRECNVRVPSL